MEEKSKEQIRQEARNILDKFGKTLGKVKISESKNMGVDGDGTRKDGLEKCDPAFRERMFANAPNVSEDFVIAEKASW